MARACNTRTLWTEAGGLPLSLRPSLCFETLYMERKNMEEGEKEEEVM